MTSRVVPARIAEAARRIEWLRARGMLLLLLLLVISVFVLPAMIDAAKAWRIAIDIMLTLALVSGVAAIVDHRGLAVSLAGLCLVVIGLRAAEWVAPADLLQPLQNLSVLAGFLVLAIAVGINVFAKDLGIGERVAGAIVLYLLIGLIWANLYMFMNRVVPGAFARPAGDPVDFPEWVYFSFVTLTTVGYGDITPVARSVRALATLEAFVGQLYPAIIIARFVSSPRNPG